jgi:16S rRNA U1498 N3-methylase RsmE
MKRILREAVSLGVGEIWTAGTDLGEKSYREAKLWLKGTYRSYLLDGAQQAGETAVPALRQFRNLADAFQAADESKPDAAKLILDPVPGSSGLFRTARELLSSHGMPKPAGSAESAEPAESAGKHVMLAVGSERGWSERERILYAQHDWISTELGSRILRTETACSAGISVLLAALGYLENSGDLR